MGTLRASILAVAATLLAATHTPAVADGADHRAELRQVLQRYLQTYRDVEGITTLSAYVLPGGAETGVAAAVGTTHRQPFSPPVRPDTLFEMGSNTKAFTSVMLLQLEAEGTLDLDQTVGDWLPQYPAWGDATLRSLLNMTSAIPTYSEAPRMLRLQATEPRRHYTPEQLVAFAYPRPGNELPVNTGYFYSNTNYILAGMIVEKAGGKPYTQQLHERILDPLGMDETYYDPWRLPKSVIDRMAGGYFENPACGEYRPDCRVAPLQPLVGRNAQRWDLSWTGAAGGIVSTPRDLATWVRALYAGDLLPPRQMRELKSLVSLRTGEPIRRVTAADPQGFGLGIGALYLDGIGQIYFYEGMTLGYRGVYAYYPENDLVTVVSINSQPPEGQDHVGALLLEMHGIFAGD